MKRVILVSANGTWETHEFADQPELEQMQKAVGGYIELVVTGHKGLSCFCNEEGKLAPHQINVLATTFVGDYLFPHDYIAGNFLIMGSVDRHGDTLGLTPTQEAYVVEILTRLQGGLPTSHSA